MSDPNMTAETHAYWEGRAEQRELDAPLRRIGVAVAVWAGMARLWKARCRKCGANTSAGNPYGEACPRCDGLGWS